MKLLVAVIVMIAAYGGFNINLYCMANCPPPCKYVQCQYVGQWQTMVNVKQCTNVQKRVHPFIAALIYQACKDVTAVYAERDLMNHKTCVGPNSKPKIQTVALKVEKFDCSSCGGKKYSKQITKRYNILVWPQDCVSCQYIILNAKWDNPEKYSTSYRSLNLSWEGEF